jgi:hypothetical protein
LAGKKEYQKENLTVVRMAQYSGENLVAGLVATMAEPLAVVKVSRRVEMLG